MTFLRLSLTAAVALTLLTACDGPQEAAIMAEPIMMEGAEARDIAITPAPVITEPRSRHRGTARRGVVTAGDIDDTLNIADFRAYLARNASKTRLPVAHFGQVLALQLKGADGQPLPGQHVTLRRPGASEPFWSGESGVDGHITLFPAMLGEGGIRDVEVSVFSQDHRGELRERVAVSQNRQVIRMPLAADYEPDFLDLAFVIDTTGSMQDELDWLTRELRGIVRAAKRAAPDANIRFGLVLYRDHGDEYVVKNYGFTRSQGQMQRWLRAQRAEGGGDYPEAAAQALRSATDLNWRRGHGERLLFHIADAPPHSRDADAYLAAASAAMNKQVQIFGLGASGVAAESEFLMRQAAAMTGGRYLFLTDDSGVGNAHAEPTINCYRVTLLKDLLVRVLRSELSGQRIEAAESDVIRRVGSYQNGRCRG